MQPESTRPLVHLDCPNCGKMSEIDPASFPMICPECRQTLSAFVSCTRCEERVPYQGEPEAMTNCPKCGADPLAPVASGSRLKHRMGSAAMILAALATIALLAATTTILYLRFLKR